MDLRSLSCALLVVLIWGVNFSVIKFGLDELPPFLFSGLRFLIVALPAVFFIPFPKTSVWNVLGVGLFLGILKFSFVFVAMRSDASAGLASLLIQAQVVFTICLSLLLFKERISRFQTIGILFACAGFGLFFYTTGGNASVFGVSLLLAAALFWSVANLIMKRMGKVNLLHFMVWVSLVPPLPLFALSFWFETQEPIALLLSTSSQAWLALAFVGYISTLVAFAIWGWLLRSHSAATVTPFALLIPIVGMSAGSLLLGETLTQLEIIAGILILLGLTISVLGARLWSLGSRLSGNVKLKWNQG